jgi:PAS domain S-box-containing protein
VETSGEAIFLTDLQGVITYINPAFTRLYGFTVAEVVGRTTPRLLKSGKIAPDHYAAFWTKILGGQVVSGEWVNKTRDGRLIDVVGSASPVMDSAGQIIGFLAIQRDITERRQVEQSIRESEERFRMLFQDVQSVSVQGYSMDGTTHYWNKASENLYGYTSQDAIGKNLLDLIIPPEMAEGVRQAIAYMVESGQPIPASELNLIKKDGARVAVYSSHAIVKGAGGVPELFCIDIDLSASKQAQQAILESEERFSTIFHASPIPILIVGAADGKFVDVNEAFQSLSGYGREEVIGYATLDLNQWINPGDLRRLEMTLREQGTVHDFDARLRAKSGLIQDVLMSAAPIEVSGERYIVILA